MTRLAIATLAGIAGLTLGTYAGVTFGIAAPLLVGFLALAVFVANDIIRRDLPPATRRELAAAHRLNRLDLSGALRRNERTN